VNAIISSPLLQKFSTAMFRNRERARSRYSMRLSMLLFMVFAPWILFSSHADSQHRVVIITSTDSSFQQQAAVRIRQNLYKNDIDATIIPAIDVPSLSRDSKTVYVAIGESAIKTLNEFDENAIVLRLNNRRIPDINYTSIQSDLITAQSPCRHLQLIKAVNPRWMTVGVLSSIDSADTTAELTRCAIRFNMNLQLYAIADEKDLQKTLETAVENNKVLLAIVDPLVYNSRTVKNILLTSYRHRKPVIGYSESFVQAGAVAAIFTSPQTAGDDATRIINDFFDNNWQFTRNTYIPSEFTVSTNTQVATSLDINLPAIDAILQSIRLMEMRR